MLLELSFRRRFLFSRITEEHPALAQAAKHVLANVLDGRERNVNRQLIPPVPFPLPQSSAAEANDMEEVDPGVSKAFQLLSLGGCQVSETLNVLTKFFKYPSLLRKFFLLPSDYFQPSKFQNQTPNMLRDRHF